MEEPFDKGQKRLLSEEMLFKWRPEKGEEMNSAAIQGDSPAGNRDSKLAACEVGTHLAYGEIAIRPEELTCSGQSKVNDRRWLQCGFEKVVDAIFQNFPLIVTWS